MPKISKDLTEKGKHFMKKKLCTVDSGNSKLGFVTNFVY